MWTTCPTPAPRHGRGRGRDDDDDDTYIPSEMEKRINAMTPEQWKRWQLLGGVGVGIAIVACLFAFGQELASYGLIVAALLAIVLPRYLERAWRCKLNTARMAMIVTMVIGLVASSSSPACATASASGRSRKREQPNASRPEC